MSETLLLHLLFAASMAVYAVGKVLDYRNSKGRGEQNPDFQDARGYFDGWKYTRASFGVGLLIVGMSLSCEFLMSRVSPDYAYSLLIGIGTALALGIYAMILSRR